MKRSQIVLEDSSDSLKKRFFGDKEKRVLISGGAEGADTLFSEQAFIHGHDIYHMSFDSHYIKSQKGKIIKKSNVELQMGRDALEDAAISLNKKLPNNSYSLSLLLRNFWQINNTGSVFCVGEFSKSLKQNPDFVGIDGGTGWTCQLYCNHQFRSGKTGTLDLFFFDQVNRKWHQCDLVEDERKFTIKWNVIEPPRIATVRYTGIGTRKINEDGKKAILDLYNNQLLEVKS